MSKDKLTDYSSTADSNTDIGGISIAEGMSPSAVNNAIREQMSHQKEAFGSGTPLYVDQTNNRVGIRCTPERDLHVKGASGDPVHFKLEGDPADYARIMFDDGTTDNIGELRYNFGSDYMSFNTNSAERMRLDSSGNVLVGKTASGIGTEGIELRANDDVMITQSGDTCLYINRLSSDGGIIDLRKDGSTVGVIGTQNWGIGTSSPQKNLQITSSTATLRLEESGGNSKRLDLEIDSSAVAKIMANQSGSQIAFHTVGSERARFDSSGTLGIGKTPNSSLATVGTEIHQDGTVFMSRNSSPALFINRSDDGTVIQIFRGASTVGTISVTSSNTAYNTSSDRRLKSNIQDAASASDKIDAIQVRQFDWNVDGHHQDYGLIAQELQPIEPIAVTGDADSDEMMGVDYSKLVPMLIKEIQELRGRVAALEAS